MVANCDKAVLGKEHVIRLSLTCMLSEGHLLLEDFPGTGKTQLARAHLGHRPGHELAHPVHARPAAQRRHRRDDLRPGHQGLRVPPRARSSRRSSSPTRSTAPRPKTQSALLEVMEEGKVTVDGVRHEVGAPFMVIATQNPIEQAGTYRLPEAQLDRFLMKTSLGYPDHDATVRVLRDAKTRDRTKALEPVVTSQRRHRHGRARRRGPRRRRDPRLRLAHRRGDPAAHLGPPRACRSVAAWPSCAAPRPGPSARAATT